jgi:CYTH domain-containing protein
MAGWLDPFGCPEFLVDDFAFRQMVGTELIRFGFYSNEGEERILRVKIVFPLERLFAAQQQTLQFLRQPQRPRLAVM